MSFNEVSHLFYQVKLLEQQINKVFEEKVGLSLSRYKLLLVLQKEGPCLHADIQAAMKIDQGAITRHLKILETEGYVTRYRNPDNNREVFVELTEKAQTELVACLGKHQRFEALLDSYMTATDLTTLSDLLKTLTEALHSINEK
ncbi:transcriptional regulator [Vagococcus penaei]|uniref:Transcriptional regulator n=1 Tax=Vagococcus penaei TaxID=633807 RepID=A0A1Q2D5T4_9ENTE|nr:MarR family winged helix-turn-helix transcriptional regulator [Vagococcus penaei]AQP53722.1 transcriptional regulator [Vagococcus penaei]RST99471.1 transcriptional regulator [Vagococcus penaei]